MHIVNVQIVATRIYQWNKTVKRVENLFLKQVDPILRVYIKELRCNYQSIMCVTKKFSSRLPRRQHWAMLIQPALHATGLVSIWIDDRFYNTVSSSCIVNIKLYNTSRENKMSQINFQQCPNIRQRWVERQHQLAQTAPVSRLFNRLQTI